ncbi:hypothetical protein M441DRAFT_348561 [Trichoderma asperellum CBS 433.97]|uniref:Uncharacterized protein n=1 Tax=Trichoderma asperellum (strain ATCC 204424 / CBS 433.97 / NBRC 101777) TaxID=1042311 RepID=A0A2T3ZHZ0_TRIA4|nr:hypothetical protein M441DRAFT_348561 [Trichoderma asperellum CBS 433.97]PTB44420.1 hypothetical protein M441DRAFT_348561 [Trichoderma asperellum CBS 433.97]
MDRRRLNSDTLYKQAAYTPLLGTCLRSHPLTFISPLYFFSLTNFFSHIFPTCCCIFVGYYILYERVSY